MEQLDKDLASIQEVRDLIRRATRAQAVLADYTQEQVDALVEALARTGEANAACLAEMAVEETGFGKVQDKITKNLVASKRLADSVRGMKTIGLIAADPVRKIQEVAVPYGVVAGLVPSTNPTSTSIYKSIIAIKAGNALVISPHPAALKCISETVRLLRETLQNLGAPADLITVMSKPTLEGTSELMKNPGTGMILATGGSAMVKAAYSSGNPALGVGPGNVPAFIERTADIKKAVSYIMVSKTFDNGTVCASEQHVITEHATADQVKAEMIAQGCYFLNEVETAMVEKVIVGPGGGLNARIVGKPAVEIACMAGLEVPAATQVLVAEQCRQCVGKKYPFSWEKLSPLLSFYRTTDAHDACQLCLELLHFEGIGHSMVIHTQNEQLVLEFALKKPVSRLLVNTPATQGAIGATTGLAPAFTLGCGGVGGSATSDNVTPLHLFNKRYVAYGICEPSDSAMALPVGLDIEAITRMVLERLRAL